MQIGFKAIIDFIRNLYGKPSDTIHLHTPFFAGNEKKYLEQCIDTAFVSSVGKFVELFEEKIAEYTISKKAVACVNGTNALHIALKLVGVEQDHEVITQPLTFVATANAIVYCGAKPIFLDVDMDTMGLSPKSLLQFLETKTFFNKSLNQQINKLTNLPITACVPMHTFGQPARIDEIVDICDQFHIPVVEDAAEGMGSYYKEKHAGTFGKIGVISFNGNKILTTGGGGMLLFQDEELAVKAKHLTTQAKISHQWEFIHDAIGYNYRLPNINAALGVAQLEQLNNFLISKRELAKEYEIFFKNSNIEFVKEIKDSRSNYWLNCILLEDLKERNAFLKYANSNDVMIRPAWQLMTNLSMFKDFQSEKLINAISLSSRLVNLPSSVRL